MKQIIPAKPVVEVDIDPTLARSMLAFLCGLPLEPLSAQQAACSTPGLAIWLLQHDLASLAQSRCRSVCPELAEQLTAAMYSTTAQNALHWHNLLAIDTGFSAAGLTALLLKGAALADTVYDQPEQRPMTDVDLWLQEVDMEAACAVMAGLDFVSSEKEDRPLALQSLSGGEVQFRTPTPGPTLVELHLSPFPGWWLARTAAVDTASIWSRSEPLPDWHSFYQMAPEDTVIQLAVHMSINHQFGLAALRSLVDIALTAQVRDVDWQVVAQRSRQWHVATAVWLVLNLLEELVGLPGLDEILPQLQPSIWRRRRLQKFVSAEKLLTSREINQGRKRFQFLLLLVDHLPDAAHLFYRTLWPEQGWLDARYGGGVSSWQHLRRVLVEGEV